MMLLSQSEIAIVGSELKWKYMITKKKSAKKWITSLSLKRMSKAMFEILFIYQKSDDTSFANMEG